METRRGFVKTFAAASVLGATGCIGGTTSDPAGTAATASFFVLHDFARNVAGDTAEVTSLVPPGQGSHGWEPSAQVQLDAARSDVFLHLSPGAQGWADDVAANLERDSPDVVVVDVSEGIDLLPAEEGHDEESHDRGGRDPHFWMDPVRAKWGVDNVAAGLAEADPGSAETYESNAAAYREEIDGLHDDLRTRLEGAPRDAVVLAGHDVLRYTADRYGFEVHSPVGASPDASPSPRDVQRVTDAVRENDLRHVLADALDSQRLAESLAAETGTEVLPVTAVSGQTEEWRRRDWGYLGQMRNVNLDSLATALEAEP